MLNFYVVEPKFSNNKEIAIFFSVNKEKSLFENCSEKFFYLTNSKLFISEKMAFSSFENFSKLKGFDIEEFFEESEESELNYNELYNLIRNIYLHELIYQNISEDNKFLLLDSKESISIKKIIDIKINLHEKLKKIIKNIMPAYYGRYFIELQEEFKTLEEWSSFYNVDFSKSKQLKSIIEKNHKYVVNFIRIELLELLLDVNDLELTKELDYELKTYFDEPK